LGHDLQLQCKTRFKNIVVYQEINYLLRVRAQY